MIAPEILKKHNLKAVPFSCIREGQTFMDENCLSELVEFSTAFWMRRLQGRFTPWADETPDMASIKSIAWKNDTVYVPVWRPTKITL